MQTNLYDRAGAAVEAGVVTTEACVRRVTPLGAIAIANHSRRTNAVRRPLVGLRLHTGGRRMTDASARCAVRDPRTAAAVTLVPFIKV